MSECNYFKYLFSDKGAKVTWIFIFVVLLLVSSISLSIHFAKTRSIDFNMNTLINFWHLAVFVIIYFGFYTSSFVNYKKQVSYLKKISTNEIEEVEVEVFQSSFIIKPTRQNFDAKINVTPKIEKFKLYIKSEYFLLFGVVREFGLFRMHMKPLLISTSNSKEKIHTKKLNTSKLEIENNNTVVYLKDHYKSISKLVVKNRIISNS